MTREPIALYRGPTTLRSDELAIEGEAAITFEWRPKPAVRFSFGSNAGVRPSVLSNRIVTAVEPTEADLTDPFDTAGLGTELDGTWNYTTAGDVPHVERGNPTRLARVRLAVINLTDAELPRHRRDEPYTDYLEFEVGPWHLRLEAVSNNREWLEEVKLDRGFHVTHWLEIRRQDGAEFAASEIEGLKSALWHVLSFTRGALVGLALPTGFASDGSVRWCQWWTTIVAPWRSTLTWFDQSCFSELGPLTASWLKRCEDDYWRDVLERAIRMTITANEPNPVDVSIPTAFTGFELLAWAVLVVDQRWVRPGDGELKAAGMLRLLLRWAGIDPTLPPELERLRQYAGGAGDLDIPGALAFVRNRLVHPGKNPERGWPPADAMIDAWRVALETLELVILRLLDYEGNYGHRRHLQGRWIGDVEPVPWARHVEASAP